MTDEKKYQRYVEQVELSRRVAQWNPLLKLTYSMSNRAQRLARIIISQVDDVRDDSFPELVFRTDDLAEALGLEGTRRRYEYVRQALLELGSKALLIPAEFSKDGADVVTAWFQKGRLYRGEARTVIQLDPELMPFLIQLRSRFSKYQLAEVLGFRGDYTVRFYEWFLAEQYTASRSGRWYLSLDVHEIRDRLGMLNDDGVAVKYPRWPDLRRFVIEPTIEEISEKSAYSISYEASKKGRSVASLQFHIVPKSKKSAPKKPPVEAKRRDKEDQRYAKLDKILKAVSEDTQVDFMNREGDIFKENKVRFSERFSEETIFMMTHREVLDEFEDRLLGESKRPK